MNLFNGRFCLETRHVLTKIKINQIIIYFTKSHPLNLCIIHLSLFLLWKKKKKSPKFFIFIAVLPL